MIAHVIPMKIIDGVQVPKVRVDFIVDDLSALGKNTKTKNILCCGLGPDKYNQISNFTTAKKI